jgi:hypothetical protein
MYSSHLHVALTYSLTRKYVVNVTIFILLFLNVKHVNLSCSMYLYVVEYTTNTMHNDIPEYTVNVVINVTGNLSLHRHSAVHITLLYTICCIVINVLGELILSLLCVSPVCAYSLNLYKTG